MRWRPPRGLGSSQTSRSRRAQGESKPLVRRETEDELCRNLGDDGLRRAAYRGG